MTCPGCQFAHCIVSAPLHPVGQKPNAKRPSGYSYVCPVCGVAFAWTAAGITRAQWQTPPAAPVPGRPERTIQPVELQDLKLRAPRT